MNLRPSRTIQTGVALVLVVFSSLLIPKLVLAQINERPVLIGAVSRGYGVHYTSRGLRVGLGKLGYKEFVDYVIGDFYTEGSNERLEPIVEQMVANGSHILVAMNEQAALAAKKYQGKIPILFSGVSDPVGLELIDSFAKPARGVTGITDIDHELDAERIRRFVQLLPNLKRVLYAYQPDSETDLRIDKLRQSSDDAGITLVEQPLVSQAGANAWFAQIQTGDYDAILSPNNSSLGLMGLGVQVSARTGIPTLAHTSDVAEAGGLASYGASYHAAGVQLARMVDKIIKGIDAGNIPVEVNRTLEFVINLQVANRLGLRIAPDVLFQADRVIR